MTLRDEALLSARIWVCVFPGVLLLFCGFELLDVGWPMWMEIMVSIGLTAPPISFVISPQLERVVAAASDGGDLAEMKIGQTLGAWASTESHRGARPTGATPKGKETLP